MKYKNKYPHLTVYTPPCPNAADDHDFAQKALDILTGLVSIAGLVCAMGVLVVIS